MSRGPFSRVYPKSGRLLFDGGKNSKFERSLIEDNESPDALNVVFTNGAVETRQGTSKFNSSSLGSFAFDGLYTRRSNTGSETMVVFGNGTAYQSTSNSFITLGSAQSVFTAGNRIAASQMENHLFIGNGGVIPYKYNGTDFTRHGVYPPTTTATVTSNGAGTLSGDHQYKVTFVNTQLVEGDAGPATTTFAATSTGSRLLVSSIPVGAQSYGVASRRLYRKDGSTYKRVIEIADNTTTTYDDNIATAALGATAPTDNGVPPLYSVIVYHQNRLFMNDPSNPSFLWYTNLGEPYTVASTNFFQIGDDATDTIKALSVYDNSVLVSCEKTQWILYMTDTDPSNWRRVKLKSPFGSQSPFCFLDYNNKQLFPAIENGKFVGFAAIAGDSVDPSASLLTVSTAGSLLKSDRIEMDMFNVQETFLKNITGIIYKNKAWIAVTYSSGQTMNNRVYQMDFSLSNLSKNQKESWVPFTGINAAQFTIFNGNIYFASSTANGFVYQAEAGVYNDDGSAINSYYWTKEFSGYSNEYNFHKDFRFANLLVELVGSYYMNLNYRTNSDIGDGSQSQIDLSQGGSLWGVMVWGTDLWGGGATQKDVTLFLGSSAGKRIQFKFSNQNTADQRFKVHGMNFTYNLKGQR